MPRNIYLKYARFTAASALLSAFLLVSPPLAGAAPLPLEREGYSLTFPDGWDTLPMAAGTEGSFQVYNPELGDNVAAFGNGVPYSSALPASFWIDAYTGTLIEGFERTDNSEKTLGGRTFTTSEYKDTTVDGDPDIRLRFYIATQGEFLFISWLSYDVEAGAQVIGEMESALATLEIDASARLVRRPKAPGMAEGRGPGLDALGRNRKSLDNRAPRIPLFVRP